MGHGWIAGGSRVQVGPGRDGAKKTKEKTSGRLSPPSHHTPREFHDAVRGPPLTLIIRIKFLILVILNDLDYHIYWSIIFEYDITYMFVVNII